MLRTLAINSNQIVLSFGVLIAFWSPNQSEIEESSLESSSKSRIQGIWNPVAPFSTLDHIRNMAAALYIRPRHAIPPRITSGIRLPRTYIRLCHPPGWHPEFCWAAHSIRCLTSRIQEPDGKKGVSTSYGRHIRIGKEGVSTSSGRHIRMGKEGVSTSSGRHIRIQW